MFTKYADFRIPGFKVFQLRYRFPNGYGASIVPHRDSHIEEDEFWDGQFELAVLKFDKYGKSDLCYDTEITSDVVRGSEVRMCNLIERIRRLPKHA